MQKPNEWASCWCCGNRVKPDNAVRLKALHAEPKLSNAVVGKTYPDYRVAHARETRDVRTFGPVCAARHLRRGKVCTEAVPRSSMAFRSIDDLAR